MRRLTNVRVSVRQMDIVKNATWGTHDESWSHVRFQKLQSLVPLRMESIFEIARRGFNADWVATARSRPAIQDGWRIVAFVDCDVEMVFDVVKVGVRGRVQTIHLQEVGSVQS